MVRVGPQTHPGTTAYVSSRRGRFHPFSDDEGRTVATWYAAQNLQGALSESVFHDVPAGGGVVDVARLRGQHVFTVTPVRKLKVAAFTTIGLRRLGLNRAQLIDPGPRHYPRTALWAQSVHQHPERFDGITWVSRQDDTSAAVVLFGDRVAPADLELRAEEPLLAAEMFDHVLRLAADLKIAVIGLPFS